jgi:hypothetical protein
MPAQTHLRASLKAGWPQHLRCPRSQGVVQMQVLPLLLLLLLPLLVLQLLFDPLERPEPPQQPVARFPLLQPPSQRPPPLSQPEPPLLLFPTPWQLPARLPLQ